MTDVIDIITRKKKTLRVRPKVKAKQWDKLMEWIDSGLITITVAGTVLEKSEMKAFGETLNAEVAETERVRKRLMIKKRVRKYRSRKLTDS